MARMSIKLRSSSLHVKRLTYHYAVCAILNRLSACSNKELTGDTPTYESFLLELLCHLHLHIQFPPCLGRIRSHIDLESPFAQPKKSHLQIDFYRLLASYGVCENYGKLNIRVIEGRQPVKTKFALLSICTVQETASANRSCQTPPRMSRYRTRVLLLDIRVLWLVLLQ